MEAKLVEFQAPKHYMLERELGQGACGLTVLVHDPIINEKFVCKKYNPLVEGHRETLFANFINEIKLLYLLNHKNVVRVFNYYLYPEKFLGYIFMEFIDGLDIEDYVSINPQNVNEIFVQTIEGFSDLETHNILHRDIRVGNILVTHDGIVKIIDFGFGKQTLNIEDFKKSISLNWWCEPPSEFSADIYDFSSETYFVGKLFEKIVLDYGIQQFKYSDILKRMCDRSRSSRLGSFLDIRKEVFSEKYAEIDFDSWEKQAYQVFSAKIYSTISKIEAGAKYYDADLVLSKLEEVLKRVVLEAIVPDSRIVVRAILNGAYYYKNSVDFEVEILKRFVDTLRSCSREKRNIILSNLQTKLDSLQRYSEEIPPIDDIPF